MGIWDIIIGSKPDLDEDFDKSEQTDLALHVRQCTRRYRDLDQKINLAIRLILILCLMYLLNNVAMFKTAFLH